MKIKFSFALFFVALMAILTPRAAHADLGYWSASLIGTWKHPKTSAVYRFNSDATYTMTNAKPTEEAVIGSSGWWKIVQPTEKESGGSQEGPVALLIKQRKLNFQEDSGRKYSGNMKREYRLVVDTVEASETRKSNRNLYWIDGVNWKRIK